MNYETKIQELNNHAGVIQWAMDKLNNDDTSSIEELLDFRIKSLLTEEFLETIKAHKEKDSEELVDGLIDLVVIALGTLDILDVDMNKAFKNVVDANMRKRIGVKPERPNPLGLPDLVKPSGWHGPTHRSNLGILPLLWEK